MGVFSSLRKVSKALTFASARSHEHAPLIYFWIVFGLLVLYLAVFAGFVVVFHKLVAVLDRRLRTRTYVSGEMPQETIPETASVRIRRSHEPNLAEINEVLDKRKAQDRDIDTHGVESLIDDIGEEREVEDTSFRESVQKLKQFKH